MEQTLRQEKKKERTMEFHRFWTLVQLLFSDTSKLSFHDKTKRKKSIIRLFSSLVVFAALTALAYLLYSLAALFHVSSLLSFIPESVPSFLVTVLLFFSLFSATVGLTRSFYYSPDNRLMITYPAQGISIFLARLGVFLLSEYLRDLLVFGPLCCAYLLISHFPFYFFLTFFLALFLLTLAKVLLASLLSVPGFYLSRYLRRNSIAELIVYVLLFALFVGLVSYGMALLPNSIDIFTNWGPYFTRIQNFLKDYRDYAYPFYALGEFLLGYSNGFSYPSYSWAGFYALLSLVGLILLCGSLVVIFVSKLYLHLASESFEYTSKKTLLYRSSTPRKFMKAQLIKESALFLNDPNTGMSLFAIDVGLPIFLTLLDKIFGAMNTTVVGNIIISVVNLLILMLVLLNSNLVVARIYSSEGKAFLLNRSYPHSAFFLLASKLALPLLMGFISIVVSVVMYGSVTGAKLAPDGSIWVTPAMEIYLAIGLFAFYAGHMMFAAGLDFTSLKSNHSAETFATPQERNVVLSAFLLAFLSAVLFYFFLRDDVSSSYPKFMALGLVYLAFNLWLFLAKIAYLYREGE